jgi:hypothetical protein
MRGALHVAYLQEEHTSGTIQYTSHTGRVACTAAQRKKEISLLPPSSLSTPHDSIQMGRYADVTAFFQRAHSLCVYQTARGAAAGIHFQLPIRFSLCADKSGVSLHAEANKLAYPFVARILYM